MNGLLFAQLLATALLIAAGSLLLLAKTGQQSAQALMRRLGENGATGIYMVVVGSPIFTICSASLAWLPFNAARTDLGTAAFMVAYLSAGVSAFVVVAGVFEIGRGMLGGEQKNDLFNLVNSQKPYDTGGEATEDRIHLALSGEPFYSALSKMKLDE